MKKDKSGLNIKKDKLWFKAKRYGWGWYPVTWQGWLVTFIFVCLMIFSPIDIEKNIFLFMIWIIVMCLFLFMICKLKGEKPKWSWEK